MSKLQKILKSICKIISVLLIVLLIIVTLVSIVSHITNNGRIVIGGYSFGVIATGSMEDAISTGSFVLIKQTDPSLLTVNDIITFDSDDPSVPMDQPVTHRIVDVTCDETGQQVFITKGDANPQNDEYPVYADAIYGKIVFVSSLIGKIVQLSQSPMLYPILIVILMVNLVVSMISVVKEANKLKENTESDSNMG